MRREEGCAEKQFPRSLVGMVHFKSCQVRGLVLAAFKSHSLVCFGLGRKAACLFSLGIAIKNFQEDAPVAVASCMHLA